jgi:hypothetical protein
MTGRTIINVHILYVFNTFYLVAIKKLKQRLTLVLCKQAFLFPSVYNVKDVGFGPNLVTEP